MQCTDAFENDSSKPTAPTPIQAENFGLPCLNVSITSPKDSQADSALSSTTQSTVENACISANTSAANTSYQSPALEAAVASGSGIGSGSGSGGSCSASASSSVNAVCRQESSGIYTNSGSNKQPIKEVEETESGNGRDSHEYLRYIANSSSRRASQDLINLPSSPFAYHRALQARKNRVSFIASPQYRADSCTSVTTVDAPPTRLQQRRGSKWVLLNTADTNPVPIPIPIPLGNPIAIPIAAPVSIVNTSLISNSSTSPIAIANPTCSSPISVGLKEPAAEVMPKESLTVASTKGETHDSLICSSPPNTANAELGKHSRSPSFSSQTHLRNQMARPSIGRLSFQYCYDPAEAQRANQLHQRLLQTQTVFGAEEPKDGIGCIGWTLYVLSFIMVILTFPFSLYFCFRVVQEYERAVIFRLGRLIGGGAKGPGIFFVLPCIEAYTKVDLRTVSFDVPPQEVLTKDSVTVSVDAVIYYRVSNATIAVANVENAHHSTRSLAQTTLRNVLGTKNLSDVLTDRDSVSGAMHHILDEATEQWGITVERVEIKDVRLPVQLQRAMAAEAEASREARAKIIAAEGEMRAAKALKEAAIVISESPAALQLRYLQTLSSISSEKNSTIIFPLPIDVLKHFIK